jgi:hypothetical protein
MFKYLTLLLGHLLLRQHPLNHHLREQQMQHNLHHLLMDDGGDLAQL